MAVLTPERAEQLIRDFERLSVLVVGDLMIDRYVSGAVDRVSPEAPVPVVRVEEERAAIGGAGNVAANVAALGARCSIVGCVGDDEAGSTLTRALERLGIAVDHVVDITDRPTTTKTRVMARHQQVVRFDHEDASDVDDSVAARLAEAIESASLGSDLITLQDYNKGVLVRPVIDAALRVGKERGVPTIADPKRRNFFAFGGVTVFKPNAKELEDALGDFLHPEDAEWMEGTRARLECEHLLLTLGERGMSLQSRGGGHSLVSTVARDVYDVSGAGDTVTAVMGLALAAGGTGVEAATLATHAAALEVAKAGVATVSPTELLNQVRAAP